MERKDGIGQDSHIEQVSIEALEEISSKFLKLLNGNDQLSLHDIKGLKEVADGNGMDVSEDHCNTLAIDVFKSGFMVLVFDTGIKKYLGHVNPNGENGITGVFQCIGYLDGEECNLGAQGAVDFFSALLIER